MSWRPPLEATRLRYRLENDLENVEVDVRARFRPLLSPPLPASGPVPSARPGRSMELLERPYPRPSLLPASSIAASSRPGASAPPPPPPPFSAAIMLKRRQFVRDDSLGDHLDLSFVGVPDDKFRYTAPMSALASSEDIVAVVERVVQAGIGRRAPEPRWGY
eukprot:tig00021432_g21197.t1